MVDSVRLGYLGFEVRDVAAWESFATRVLGLEVARRTEDGGMTLRMDAHAQRFIVAPGPSDDVFVVGWEVDDDGALGRVVSRLRGAGVDVIEGTRDEAAIRRVARIFKFRDPAGTPSEIFCGPEMAAEPFRAQVVRTGFVTGDQGLGHVVVTANDTEESKQFYCNLLGFRFSDRIACNVHGFDVDLAFLHGNARHHTVAIGGKQRKRIHHFMLEVRSVDEVGLAFDRCMKNGIRIMQTMGRHPNDRMLSFYGRSPSGFQFEYGWGGRQIEDDATWAPQTYHQIREWGHHPPEFLVPRPQAAAGASPGKATEKKNEREGSAGGEVR